MVAWRDRWWEFLGGDSLAGACRREGSPNQSLHLVSSHLPRVAFALISCGIPLFLSDFGTVNRAKALYAPGVGMWHAASNLLARFRSTFNYAHRGKRHSAGSDYSGSDSFSISTSAGKVCSIDATIVVFTGV